MSLKRKTLKVLSLLLLLVLSISIVTPALAEETEPTWTTVAPITTLRTHFASAVINGKIYIFGGENSSSGWRYTEVEVYDPSTNSWSRKSPMPEGSSYMESIVLNGKIYLIGGKSHDSECINKMYIYDPTNDTWDTKDTLGGICGHQVAEVDGKIYIIGGGNIVNSNPYVLGTVQVYDPITDSFTQKASMKTPRMDFKVAVVDGKIYAIGGKINRKDVTNTIEVYDPSADTWTSKASMSTSRYLHGLALINNRILVMGGYTQGVKTTASVEEYDPTTDTWLSKTSMATARSDFGTINNNGKIYVLGGITYGYDAGKGDATPSVEKFNTEANVWTTIKPMTGGCNVRFQTAVVNDEMYVISGETGGNNSKVKSTVIKYALASTDIPTAPINLTAIGGDSKVDLSWGAVTDATSYNVYRSTTSGGPYTKIADEVNGTNYTDSDVTNGTTYYYVVTAVTADGESEYSNEASTTPNKSGTEPEPEAGNTILEIYMVDGTEKEYELTSDKINEFLEWFDTRSEGSGKAYYVFEKTYNMGPYTSRDDYIIFDKIRDFEVNQYN